MKLFMHLPGKPAFRYWMLVASVPFALSVPSMALAAAPAKSAAGERSAAQERGKQQLDAFKKSLCDQLDFSLDMDKNPFLYHNPDVKCDLGFSLPGLPSFGGSLTGLDSCKLLKSITGDTVRAINDSMKGAVDKVLGDGLRLDVDLGKETSELIGTDGNVSGGRTDVNLNRALEDSLK